MNCCKRDDGVENLTMRKIPRPPNAFMLFANANRKLMAQRYPTESNKDISKRLGCSWKSLELVEKNKYFDKAKVIDSEHKKKYPNYVYNPKEARIRKAMREANRDRSIGTSPMLPRLGERLPSHSEWTQSQEDPLMMNPMSEMRRMDSSICNYPMSSPENHFMPSIDSYNKMNTAPMVPNYMQPSPLAQLQQQQTEMWHPYHQKSVQPRPLASPFHRPIMQGMQQPPYMSQEPVQETATNLIMDKSQESPVCMPQTHSSVPEHNVMTPPLAACRNTPERPKSAQANQQHYLENGAGIDCMQTTGMMDGNKLRQSPGDQYMPSPEALVTRKNFEAVTKAEAPVVAKKISEDSLLKAMDDNYNKTEMPNFSPPQNFFTDEYRMDYITKHFANLPDYSLTTIYTSDGFSFPYASLSPKGHKCVESFLEVSAINEEPILISTEYGYIPVLEVDSLN